MKGRYRLKNIGVLLYAGLSGVSCSSAGSHKDTAAEALPAQTTAIPPTWMGEIDSSDHLLLQEGDLWYPVQAATPAPTLVAPVDDHQERAGDVQF